MNIFFLLFVVYRVQLSKSTIKIETTNSAPIKFVPESTVCESKDSSFYHLRKTFKSESCYFIVKGATFMSNEKKDGKFIFNIAKAREICKQFNAKLPTVNSHDEHIFLSKGLGTEINALVIDGPRSELQMSNSSQWLIGLGLEQIKSENGSYHYRWNDYTTIDFEAEWRTKFQPSSYTAMERMLSFDQTPRWINIFSGSYPFGEGSESATMVICKQKYHSATANTPVIKTAASKCALGDTNAYPKTAVFNHKICYFTVNGSTAATSHDGQYPNGSSVQFDIWTAREICKKEDSTLPIIQSADEHKFVMDNFKPRDFQWNQTSFLPDIHFLALDLKQTTNTDKYEWADKSLLNYEPATWVGKDKYAYFTKMSLSSTAWYNDMDSLKSPIGVLCRQPHLSQSIVLPSLFNEFGELKMIAAKKRSSATVLAKSDILPFGPRIVCNQSNEGRFSRTLLFYKDGVCYFIIAGVSTYMNRREVTFKGRGKVSITIDFWMEESRKLCERYNATLPIIKTQREAEIILYKFMPFHFEEGLEKIAGYALGMTVETINNKVIYKWDDNSAVDNYNILPYAWHWDDSYVKENPHLSLVSKKSFVYMEDYRTNNYRWKTSANGSVPWPIGFLCQQRFNISNQGSFGRGVEFGDPQSSGSFVTPGFVLCSSLVIIVVRVLWKLENAIWIEQAKV